MRRVFLLASAVAGLCAAFILVVSAGLPERVVYREVFSSNALRPIAPEVNSFAPGFETWLLDGNTINLSNLRGKPVIINFWATWCGPCRIEMPLIQNLYDDHLADGLRVVAVNLGESEIAVRNWVREARLTYDIVIDSQREIESLYQLRGVPSTFIVAPNGLITQVFYGPVSEIQLREAIITYFP